MKRYVEREWLDELPPADPAAIGSRNDLKRLNQCMGNARTVALALRRFPAQMRPIRLLEPGSGDGHFLLQVAHNLGGAWRGTQATLVDLQTLLTAETAKGYSRLGWTIKPTQSDIFDWFRQSGTECFDLVVANLFLHHFESERLEELLRSIQQCSAFFAAVEPRRSMLSLIFSKLVGLIGCNSVTRHDAPVSVRAGFSGLELSQLWNGNGQWTLTETRVGPFSHLFVAQKRNGVL